MNQPLTTLTEIETLGLQSQFNFADGHAYHDLALEQQRIIGRLGEIWEESARRKVKEAEELYKIAFARLAESPSLFSYPHFRICPTASNSIDTVATWLAEKKMSVALVHPTFDNLYLILKRRGVKVDALEENILHAEGAKSLFAKTETDAIFLVNPNNPTGLVFTEAQFREIVEACVEQKKVLLLDNTFRFFVNPSYDQYQILLDSGVTFLSIEDTGKVWPTQDMKASLIFSSPNIAKEVDLIYEEIYLCVSNFSLGILTEFLVDAKNRGLEACVWKEVATRRALLRKVLEASPFRIDPVAKNSVLSVEWVNVRPALADDLAALEHFKSKDLMVLPGRNFFWNASSHFSSQGNIRLSLLKPKLHFLSGLKTLSQGLSEISQFPQKERKI